MVIFIFLLTFVIGVCVDSIDDWKSEQNKINLGSLINKTKKCKPECSTLQIISVLLWCINMPKAKQVKTQNKNKNKKLLIFLW